MKSYSYGVHYVGLRIDLSSMKSSFDLQAFTFMCEVNLDGLCTFKHESS